jgi:hypothetical protein
MRMHGEEAMSPSPTAAFEDARHPAVDELHRRRCQHAAQRLDPGLDLAAADGPDLAAPEGGLGVAAKEDLDLAPGSMDLGGAPLLGALPNGISADTRLRHAVDRCAVSRPNKLRLDSHVSVLHGLPHRGT